jgi:hypothetical protein
MIYSKKEQLTIEQNKTHDEFTNYLTSVVGLKTPRHQTGAWGTGEWYHLYHKHASIAHL